jgi:hypothetical protein
MANIHPNFRARYPLSCALSIQPASTGQGATLTVHPLFGVDDLLAALGPTRFNNLKATIKTDYCCGHRTDSKGLEIHCFSADDVEAFLRGGG